MHVGIQFGSQNAVALFPFRHAWFLENKKRGLNPLSAHPAIFSGETVAKEDFTNFSNRPSFKI